jgi:hypothetical protein
MIWLIFGIVAGLYSAITGISIWLDPDCDTVSIGGQGRSVMLTCIPEGYFKSGDIDGNLAGLLAVLAGIAMIIAGAYPFLKAKGYDIFSPDFWSNAENAIINSNGTPNLNSISTNYKDYDLTLASSVTTDTEQLKLLTKSNDVRVLLALINNPNSNEEILGLLATHESEKVRCLVAEKTHSEDLLRLITRSSALNLNVINSVIDNPNTTEDVLLSIAQNSNSNYILTKLASNDSIPTQVLKVLFKRGIRETIRNKNFVIEKWTDFSSFIPLSEVELEHISTANINDAMMPTELRNEINRHKSNKLFMKWLPLKSFTLLTIGSNVFLYGAGYYYGVDIIILSFIIGISGGIAIWIFLATAKWANRRESQK